jgi:hypothetical protein
MRPRSVPLLLLSGFFLPLAASPQTPQTARSATPQAPYTLHIPVNEISLTFHAAEANGKPLTRLTTRDLTLSDNGKAQNHIVLLQSFEDLPIRAGFLFDISNSMLGEVEFNRSIIRTYASRLLRKGYDRAFVELFDTEPLITQGWTDDDTLIAIGAAKVQGREDHLPATAFFDTLYATCRDQWKPNADTATGNFILIFTDGMDDASHAYLREAVDMCQRTRTAIYAVVNHRNCTSPRDSARYRRWLTKPAAASSSIPRATKSLKISRSWKPSSATSTAWSISHRTSKPTAPSTASSYAAPSLEPASPPAPATTPSRDHSERVTR